MSIWANVPTAPPDPILSIGDAWKNDPDSTKMNLGVGAYRTEEGKPLLLKSVAKAEAAIVANANRDKEYLPITGDPVFCKLAQELAFGAQSEAVTAKRIATVQSLSGTGALRLGTEFLVNHYNVKEILIPDPTWATHPTMFAKCGLTVKRYRYYDPATRGLNFEGMVADLRSATPGSVVLLHACAHNPTGVDPTPEQWKKVLAVVKEMKLLAFMDCAYQGFASGDLDRDAAAIRLFADAGLQMLLAQSFAKNMGLYGERVGAFSLVCRDAETASRVEGQLKLVIRPMYSNPPKHGAAIAAKVLGDPALYAEWKEELSAMAGRIDSMRKALHQALTERNAPGDWTHVLKQIGMFSYTGLTRPQCENMTKKWHVYMTMDGRISMAGLSAKRAGYLADAIIDSISTVPSSSKI